MEAKTGMKMSKRLDAVGEDDKDFVVLSTGVELYVKQAPPVILIQVMTAKQRPEPPEVFIKDIGKSIVNSDDPDYIARVKAWEMEYNSGMLYALISLGTSLKSLPKGMEGPDPKQIKIPPVCENCGTKNKTDETQCSKCGSPLPRNKIEEIEPQWIKDYQSLKLPIMPESKSWRYTTWVFFVAAPTDKDIAAIGEAVKKLSGVREADVQSAETFPGSD